MLLFSIKKDILGQSPIADDLEFPFVECLENSCWLTNCWNEWTTKFTVPPGSWGLLVVPGSCRLRILMKALFFSVAFRALSGGKCIELR